MYTGTRVFMKVFVSAIIKTFRSACVLKSFCWVMSLIVYYVMVRYGIEFMYARIIRKVLFLCNIYWKVILMRNFYFYESDHPVL